MFTFSLFFAIASESRSATVRDAKIRSQQSGNRFPSCAPCAFIGFSLLPLRAGARQCAPQNGLPACWQSGWQSISTVRTNLFFFRPAGPAIGRLCRAAARSLRLICFGAAACAKVSGTGRAGTFPLNQINRRQEGIGRRSGWRGRVGIFDNVQ